MANTLNQKRRRAERTSAFIDQLINDYPACFSAKRDQVRPLAIGIEKAIRQSLEQKPETKDTPSWLIRQALARYTRSPAYLEAIIAGAERIDLQGQSVEPVTEAAIERAKEQRAEQKARTAERRRAHAEAAAEEKRRAKLEQLAERFNQ
ncbi:MAG: ProQ/FinO family protein [Spiribacter sp.]|jgi:ProP effector|nr:ProQ/FinO family protein [Spiribacter sp.]MDR9488935.1 ProQ/FinO family protein [Spiribacter sp.]